MKWFFSNHFIFWLFLLIPAAAHAEIPEDRSTPLLGEGIVVESLTSNGEALKAGIRNGDILIGWARGGDKGKIESPFDLPYIGFEQAPRGTVWMEGRRRGKKKKWLLLTVPWGIASRPNITGSLLSIYLQAEELAHSGNFTEAVKYWRSASADAQTAGFPWLAAWFLSHAGEALFRTKQMQASDAFYGEAITLAQSSSPIIRGDLFRQWASQLEFRGELDKAKNYYEAELVEWRQLGADLLIAKNLNALGAFSLGQGDFDNAENYFIQSLAISEELAPAGLQRAIGYANLGVLYQDRGNLAKAEANYRLALAIEKKYFNTSYMVGMLTNLGILARWRGELATAEEYHRRALTLAKKMDLPLNIADVLDNISDCRLERGDLAGAEAYQRQALSIRERSGADLSAASSLAGLGKIARTAGNFDLAENYYRKALATGNKLAPSSLEQATFLEGLGDVLVQSGKLNEAEVNYRQALAITDQLVPKGAEHAEILAALGADLRQQHRLGSASELYRQALENLEYQTASVGSIEETQAHYRARHIRYFREYADLLVELGDPELGLQVLERAHARSLFEMLAGSQVDVRRGIDSELLAQQYSLRQSFNAKSQYRIRLLNGNHTSEQLAALDREIATIQERYLQVKEEIRSSNPSYASLTQVEPLDTNAIRILLDDKTILLEYSLGEERSLVWVVTSDSVSAHELPKRVELERVVRHIYRILTDRNHNAVDETEAQRRVRWNRADREYSSLSAELSRMILGPVAQKLGDKRLVIVGDGALQYIPFAALPSPLKPTTPLVVEHEIVNLPSASVLAELRRAREARPPTVKEVAVLADPVFSISDERVVPGTEGHRQQATPTQAVSLKRGSRHSASPEQLIRSATDVGLGRDGSVYLSRLLSTRREAESIMAVSPPGKRLKAVDFDASRAMAMNPTLGQYHIVHFATHGFLDSKHPELSGLVFSLINKHGRAMDGFLSLQDIYNLNLPVDLVVLSACETALGEEINGEGLIGLTRAFMYAGASRVVASLWSVSDEATSELMALLYRSMEVQHLPPAAALRQAQIQMWKQSRWAPPYYWAAFQIQGEWK